MVRGAQALTPLQPALPVQPAPVMAPVTPVPAMPQTESPTVNSLIQSSLSTAATTSDVPPPPAGWQPVTEDVQDLAERFAPRVAMPEADKANSPIGMLYAPFRQGPYLALRYLVQYQDEDLKASWEDKLYDLFRKQHYGSVVDIEPIEVYLDEATGTLAGVAFKTGQNQAFYKILVRENDWLTIKADALQAADRDGDRPRIGVSTWNHLHDLPSVLQTRPYAPTLNMPAVPVVRLDDEAKRRWRFDRRHLEGGPRGDVRKLSTDRSAL
jgi:hypothetical protein